MAKTSRAEIIAAARDLLRDKGYAGASMKDVAERVGLLKGSLYSHFASKEELVAAALDLTFCEVFGKVQPTGNWRADYELGLDHLITMLTEHRRCVGFHLAYGLDDALPELRKAVAGFFLDITNLFRDLIAQGIDIASAEPLALDTITAVEGATLWLVLYGDARPIREARATLLARADSLAADEPDAKTQKFLEQMIGDWRKASLAEKRLAAKLIETEARVVEIERELWAVSPQYRARVEAESCFE